MADRILIATLYQGTITTDGVTTNHYLLNVSPRDLVAHHSEDSVFLVVKKGSSLAENKKKEISCAFTWKGNGSNPTPFSSDPSYPTEFDVPHFLGTLKAVAFKTTVEYTLTITYDQHDYIEDPKITIKPNPS